MNERCDEKPVGTESGKNPARSTVKRLATFSPTILFALCFLAAWIGRRWGAPSFHADLLVLVAATVATLSIVAQRLPLQNVVGISVTLALISGAILLIGASLNVASPAPVLNSHFLQLPAWTFPLLWLVALVNARGIAKLLLHRWRKNRIIGLWLLAVGSGLVAGMNGRNFFVHFALAAVGLIATTPWFLDKKRSDSPPDFQPLLLVMLLLLW